MIAPAKRDGNKRHIDVHEVINGIMYGIARHWQKDLPPPSTVHDYLDLWSYNNTLDRFHQAT